MNENFISTKEHKRFTEFCDACKDYKYIGLCHGLPGIGKTVSATKYANWNVINQFNNINFRKFFSDPKSLQLSKSDLNCDTILKTSSMTDTPTRMEKAISGSAFRLHFTKRFFENDNEVDDSYISEEEKFSYLKLLIIDETDHLKYSTLEQIRSIYDQFNFGLVFIGMPGIERRLSRYPQLYSRVGFLHEFKPLSKDEMTYIIDQHLNRLDTKIKLENFDDFEAMNSIIRITKGNFRILARLFKQLERLMKINNTSSINSDLIDSARELLVLGN
jgi:DNA transposition AAA+ family ATPase